jgi:hypothetical protein
MFTYIRLSNIDEFTNNLLIFRDMIQNDFGTFSGRETVTFGTSV